MLTEGRVSEKRIPFVSVLTGCSDGHDMPATARFGEIGLEQDLHARTGHGPASWCRAGHPKHGREGPLPFAAPA